MTDRELLELAANAAKYDATFIIGAHAKNENLGMFFLNYKTSNRRSWNPLADDGDALRLAVKLGIEIHYGFDDGEIVMGAWFPETSGKPQRFEIERIGDDIYAPTRRAIVRAAAEIGKASSNAKFNGGL